MKRYPFAATGLQILAWFLSAALQAQTAAPQSSPNPPPAVPAAAAAVKTAASPAGQSPKPKELRHFLRAPDVLPGTLPEMRSVDYWVSRMSAPDEIVMPVAAIRGMNESFRRRLNAISTIDTAIQRLIEAKIDAYTGLYESDPGLERRSPAVRRSLVQDLVKKQVAYMRRGEFGNILGIVYSGGELDSMEGEMNAAGIDEGEPLVYGIATEDQTLRIVPMLRPEYTGQPDKNRTRWDIWNLDVLPIGAPVTIVHRSRSGGYLLVLSDNGFGWVATEKIALANKKQQAVFADPKQFILCTGDKVPFYSASEAKYVSGWFRMGNRLPATGTRQVLVPTRQINGRLLLQTAWLAPGADVHAGFLPYTRRNVVTESFKLLDNIYDWTGAWLGRNHETALRDIFACFGFRLPATGELLMAYGSKPTALPASTPHDQQYKTILAQEPFLTLQVCSSGHSNLFLGDYQRTPITYDTHGYTYTDSAGNSMDIRRACVGTIAWPDYFLKQDVLLLTLKQ